MQVLPASPRVPLALQTSTVPAGLLALGSRGWRRLWCHETLPVLGLQSPSAMPSTGVTVWSSPGARGCAAGHFGVWLEQEETHRLWVIRMLHMLSAPHECASGWGWSRILVGLKWGIP